MDVNKGTVLAVLSLAAPLICSCGCMIDRPLALVVSDFSVAKSIQRGLAYDKRTNTIEATKSEKSIQKHVLSAGSIPAFYYYTRSQMATKTVEYLIDTYTCGEIEGQQITGLTFIAFKETVPNQYAEHVYSLNVDSSYINSTNWDELVLPDALVASSLKSATAYMVEKGFVGVLNSLKFFLPEEFNDKAAKFEECIEAVVQNFEMPDDSETICEAFKRAVYTWLEENETTIWKLPKLSNDAQNRLQNDFYIDGFRLYMAERLFARIAADLSNTEPIGRIKLGLYRDGYIERANDGRYVSRMHYRDESNQECCKRMIKFLDIEKLGIIGKPSLVELAGGIKNA